MPVVLHCDDLPLFPSGLPVKDWGKRLGFVLGMLVLLGLCYGAIVVAAEHGW